MTNAVVSTVVGTVAVFAVLGVLSSGVVRLWQRNRRVHARELYRTIGQLLDGEENPGPHSVTERFYDMEVVRALCERPLGSRWSPGRLVDRLDRDPARNLPSYIPSELFAHVVADMASAGAAGKGKAQAHHSSSSYRFRLGEPAATEGDPGRPSATDWYRSAFELTMETATEQFRIRTRWRLFFVGLAIAVIANVSAIELVQGLWESDTVRELTLAQVDCHLEADGSPTADRSCLQTQAYVRDQLRLPVGPICAVGESDCTWWKSLQHGFPGAIPGWILTGLGVSLGAPTWFDLLRRLRG